MRIGLAGVGRIGVEHARALSEHPDVDDLILTDAAPGRADAVAAELGVKSVDGISSLPGGNTVSGTLKAAVDEAADAAGTIEQRPRRKNRMLLQKDEILTLQFQPTNLGH